MPSNLAAYHGGKVRAAIGGSSDHFGAGVLNSFAGTDTFRSLLTGKRVSWTGSRDGPLAGEVIKLHCEFNELFVLDSRKSTRAFGPGRAARHREALERTIAWFQAACNT